MSVTGAARATTTAEQWEKTLAQLRTTNEELQKRRAEAEKDRDLFRELYSKASSHASEVTKENNELSERVEIAEAQARDGVAMIKATYQERVRLLEQEVENWQSRFHILTTRDERTNDEIRRRAALEPELRAENRGLREQLELLLEDDYARLQSLSKAVIHPQIDSEETTAPEHTAIDALSSTNSLDF